jgi:hypothetical protein
MRRLCKKAICSTALLLGMLYQGGGLPASAGQYVFADRHAASNRVLDDMCGGFVTDGGLQFSLGITKAVLVDGVLEAISTLNIPNITSAGNSKLAAQQNTNQLNAVSSVVQNPGTSNAYTLVQNMGNGALIQNSANGKYIQDMSIVNMTTNSASIFRQMNIMSDMNQQLINFSR